MSENHAMSSSHDVSIDPKLIRAVEASYGRCLLKEGFLPRFYEIFMASHPDVRPQFAHTDFVEQHRLLRHGLNSLLMYAENNPLAVKTLTRIRGSHCQHQLNISPELYRYWVDSLLKTISEFDREFTIDLDRAWRQVLEPGVEYIKSGYADDASSSRSAA